MRPVDYQPASTSYREVGPGHLVMADRCHRVSDLAGTIPSPGSCCARRGRFPPPSGGR
jgi:hypothetical protein